MKKEDVLELYDCAKKYKLWDGESWLTKEFLFDSFDQKGMSYSAFMDDELAGGIIMVLHDIADNWIRFLFVKEKYRKKGVAKALLQKLVEKLEKEQSIFVDTGVIDKKAIGFYEKMGFKNRGKINSLYDNKPGYILEKVIK